MAHATTEPGLGVVYIQASDSGSGVDRIEYALDGGSFKTYGEPVVITAVGSHTVSYRAVDRAGLASATATVSLQIEAYHAGNMIQDLRFATREEGREVVTNVGVGQLLYAKQGEGEERDKDNLIKALPDYLKGANYIRLNRNDWKYDGRDFASFKAGEDMTVYIFKHKNSQADLSGWTLVQKGYPVEPSRYFKGGADIYARSYAKGDLVTIPGTKGKGECWPNLIFAQRWADQEVRITSPEPGKVLSPLATIRLVGANLSGTANAQKKWEIRYSGGQWQTVSGASVTLAYTKDTTSVEIRLTVSDAQGSYLGQHSEQYQIKNQSGVELQNPAPGWQLEAGSRVVLGFRVSDMSGADVPKANVVWQESRDGSTWGPASLEGGAILHVPSSQGAYYLKAKFDESGAASGSYPKEKVFGFQVVGSVAPVRIEFGAAQGSEYSLGGNFGEQASGKLYGFSSRPDQPCGTVQGSGVCSGGSRGAGALQHGELHRVGLRGELSV